MPWLPLRCEDKIRGRHWPPGECNRRWCAVRVARWATAKREVISSEGSLHLSTPFRLILPRHLYTAMIAQAQAELPNECCGLLAGRIEIDDNAGRVIERYPLINAASSPVRFLSDPHSMFAAVRDMRQ